MSGRTTIHFRGELTLNKGAQLILTIRQNAGRHIVLEIDSPGGDMKAGLACFDALRAHRGGSTIEVAGLAGSAAAVLAMAGQSVYIARNGFFHIHEPVAVAGLLDTKNLVFEEKRVMRYADLPPAYQQSLRVDHERQLVICSERTGIPKETIAKWCAAERRFSAAEAVRLRFADAIFEEPVRS